MSSKVYEEEIASCDEAEPIEKEEEPEYKPYYEGDDIEEAESEDEFYSEDDDIEEEDEPYTDDDEIEDEEDA